MENYGKSLNWESNNLIKKIPSIEYKYINHEQRDQHAEKGQKKCPRKKCHFGCQQSTS